MSKRWEQVIAAVVVVGVLYWVWHQTSAQSQQVVAKATSQIKGYAQ